MFQIIPGFDLALTAASGQSFRFKSNGGSVFELIAKDSRILIKEAGKDRFEFSCSQAEFDAQWRHYFDLDTDYSRINGKVPEDGSYLHQALLYAGGIRILRQDPFETLISFIISQRKTIPAIQFCVDQLCRRFGNPIGENVFAFPSPEELAGASMEDLALCSLGYRAKYIQQTAQMVAMKTVDLDSLHAHSDTELQAELIRFPGVGVKVAACVMLFAYHRLDAFPIDVWIDRVLKQEYPQGFPFECFVGCSGVLQQYLFCFARDQAKHARSGRPTCQGGKPTV